MRVSRLCLLVISVVLYSLTGVYAQKAESPKLAKSASSVSDRSQAQPVLVALNGGGGGVSGMPAGQYASTNSGVGAQLPAGFSNITHFVFIVKENRSFDSMFGTFPGANGATTALLSTGQVVPLGHMPDALPRDLGHSWGDTLDAMDYGLLAGLRADAAFAMEQFAMSRRQAGRLVELDRSLTGGDWLQPTPSLATEKPQIRALELS